MPDPFDFEGQKHHHVSARHDDPSAQVEADQQLAEALDTIRHAKAFYLIALDEDARQIEVSIGRGVTEMQMLMLFTQAVESAQRNQARCALAFLASQLGLELNNEGDEPCDD